MKRLFRSFCWLSWETRWAAAAKGSPHSLRTPSLLLHLPLRAPLCHRKQSNMKYWSRKCFQSGCCCCWNTGRGICMERCMQSREFCTTEVKETQRHLIPERQADRFTPNACKLHTLKLPHTPHTHTRTALTSFHVATTKKKNTYIGLNVFKTWHWHVLVSCHFILVWVYEVNIAGVFQNKCRNLEIKCLSSHRKKKKNAAPVPLPWWRWVRFWDVRVKAHRCCSTAAAGWCCRTDSRTMPPCPPCSLLLLLLLLARALLRPPFSSLSLVFSPSTLPPSSSPHIRKHLYLPQLFFRCSFCVKLT